MVDTSKGEQLPEPYDRPVPAMPAAIDWLIRLIKGMLVGIGAILPGLSGGVLAVIFGIYDPLMRFLGNLRHRFWQNVRYFFPVIFGGGLGVLLFSYVVEAAFGRYKALFTCLFIGFVAGTFPSLYRGAGRSENTWRDKFILVVAAVAIFFFMLAGDRTFVEIESNTLVWILSGAIVGLGMIVPGMSPSNFLMYFGLYDRMAAGITAVVRFDFSVVVPLMIGLIACVLLLAKFINWLFDRAAAAMHHFILGLVIGSSAAIFPTVVAPALRPEGLAVIGMSIGPVVALCVLFFVVGSVLSYLFSRVEERVNAQ